MVEAKDESFLSRIRGTIATVEAWDADPSLLAECRLMIPFDRLMAEKELDEDPYRRDDDCFYDGNVLFLKRLTLFFQKDVMTWVNTPPCEKCGAGPDQMVYKEPRGPTTEEEREGQANRVEVYLCKSCAAITTFPRYCSVRKLLETRKGRCGEYANLFGLYCRAAGFETRYIMDWTDHVWVEVLVGDDWIMADSCEGIINKPSMYESGWGKKLNCIIGVSADMVVDVTPRYTRTFYDKDFQDRRRKITSSEAAGEQIIEQVNASMRQGLPKSRVQQLVERGAREQSALEACKSISKWTEEERHGRGRISGSREWKVSRQEEGMNVKEEGVPSIIRGLAVEQFYPTGHLKVSVFPQNSAGIIVSGADCDVGQPECISVVVIDDVHLGCVLQCRSFATWASVGEFLLTLPSNRIVVLKGQVGEEQVDDVTKDNFKILGGFSFSHKSKDGMMFVGQVEAHPAWAACRTYSESNGIVATFPAKANEPKKLRVEKNTSPRWVSGRLSESVMPLRTQLLATDAQKHAAFLAYASKNPLCVGYTSKDGHPIYLLGNSSFPFQQGGDWDTFHFLPDELTPDCDDIHDKHDMPMFNIPVDEDFFSSLLGPSLLRRTGSNANPEATADALHNTRLVGLYFSAHWCPPCRRFTPMLIEAYNHLKEEHALHGLEIIFVSSDRSVTEFNQYYESMPWMAVPYDATRMRQQQISIRYGLQGIPGLVILDSLSGNIVVSADQSRNEVAQACQRGELAIEAMLKSWLDRVPEDSKELVSMLELSCIEDQSEQAPSSPSDHPYLVRKAAWNLPERVDPTAQVKEIFAKLVSDGETPNAAAAKAIKLVGHAGRNPSYGQGTLTAVCNTQVELVTAQARIEELVARVKANNPYSEDVAKLIFRHLSMFLGNAAREPWNPKYRSMKLSNNVVDKMTRVEGTLELICSLGMSVVPTCQDFLVIIPLAADLDQIRDGVSSALADTW
jgi:thiol-disulfide isomerase/thioredoxin